MQAGLDDIGTIGAQLGILLGSQLYGLQGRMGTSDPVSPSTLHLASCACFLSQGSGPSKFLKGCRDEVLGSWEYVLIYRSCYGFWAWDLRVRVLSNPLD